jgi:hypothetical protein
MTFTNAEADQSSLENDKSPTYTPTHTSSRDSATGDETKSPSSTPDTANYSERPSPPISILHTDGPGLSPNEPMAIVQMAIVQVENPSISDGRYVIKNRAEDSYWKAWSNPITTVRFWYTAMASAKYSGFSYTKVNEHSPIIQEFNLNFKK